jgi:hypothetical protein
MSSITSDGYDLLVNQVSPGSANSRQGKSWNRTEIWLPIACLLVALAIAIPALIVALNVQCDMDSGNNLPTLCNDAMTLFVNQANGSDTANGKSASSALKSIAQALNNVMTSSLCIGGYATIQITGEVYTVSNQAVWMTAMSEAQSRGITVEIRGGSAMRTLHTTTLESARRNINNVLDVVLANELPEEFKGSLVNIGSETFSAIMKTTSTLSLNDAESLPPRPSEPVMTFVEPGTVLQVPLELSIIAVGMKDRFVLSNLTIEPTAAACLISVGKDQTPLDNSEGDMRDQFLGSCEFRLCSIKQGIVGGYTMDIESVTPIAFQKCFMNDELDDGSSVIENMKGGLSMQECSLRYVGCNLKGQGNSAIIRCQFFNGMVAASGVAVTVHMEYSLVVIMSSVYAPVTIVDGSTANIIESALFNEDPGDARVLMLDNGSQVSCGSLNVISNQMCFVVGHSSNLTIGSLQSKAKLVEGKVFASLGYNAELNVFAGAEQLLPTDPDRAILITPEVGESEIVATTYPVYKSEPANGTRFFLNDDDGSSP